MAEGPKLTFHITRPAAPVLCKLFLSNLRARIQISPQESDTFSNLQLVFDNAERKEGEVVYYKSRPVGTSCVV